MSLTHPQLVAALIKPGEQIINELTPREAHLWHMATGVSGEAGELLDAVKKIVIYRKLTDMKNIKEELGDIEFFLEGFRQVFGISREETLVGNIEKLRKRYNSLQYSNQQAQERADKQ